MAQPHALSAPLNTLAAVSFVELPLSHISGSRSCASADVCIQLLTGGLGR
jgi:hypothetical protein